MGPTQDTNAVAEAGKADHHLHSNPDHLLSSTSEAASQFDRVNCKMLLLPEASICFRSIYTYIDKSKMHCTLPAACRMSLHKKVLHPDTSQSASRQASTSRSYQINGDSDVPSALMKTQLDSAAETLTLCKIVCQWAVESKEVHLLHCIAKLTHM